jgi:hypothetical protein
LLVDPGLALEDVQFNAHTSTLAFGQTLGLAGRTVQILACVPYVVAEGESSLDGAQILTRYSGIGDVTLRYAMNIYGAPAGSIKIAPPPNVGRNGLERLHGGANSG